MHIDDTLQEHEKLLQSLEKTCNSLQELQEKFDNLHSTSIEKFIFLHQELMKLENKKISKDGAHNIIKNKYNTSFSLLRTMWTRLPKLNNHFKFTDNKDDKRAFLVTHEGRQAFVEALDAIYTK